MERKVPDFVLLHIDLLGVHFPQLNGVFLQHDDSGLQFFYSV